MSASSAPGNGPTPDDIAQLVATANDLMLNMTPEYRTSVEATVKELRALRVKHPLTFSIALAFVGAEIASE